MPTKPDVDIKQDAVSNFSEVQGLLSELTSSELERVAIAVIREHRSRLQIAEDLFNEIDRIEASSPSQLDLVQVTHDYRLALLNLHAQHGLVSMVLKCLGYVPEVDGNRPVWN